MEEIKVSELEEAQSVNDNDLLMIIQNGVNKKVPAYKVGTGKVVEVIDNLTSTSATDALSANQGKVLNEKIIGTVLFDNSSGSQSITLSDSAENYDIFDVIYGKSATEGFASITVYQPEGKRINLQAVRGDTNNSITLYGTTVSISGTTLTVLNGKSIAFSNTGVVQGFADNPELKIYKVVGYKF